MSNLQLTLEQQCIVEAEPGHYVVTAVAGSGKTTTLAHRIHYLLNQGYDSRRILVLMFNKAAQVDFNLKLAQLIQPPLIKPEVRTFHAMGYRLYQRFVQEGYLPAFKKQILSDKEMQFRLWLLMNQHLESEQLKLIKRNKKEHVETCLQFIDAVKCGLQPPEIVFEALELKDKYRYVIDVFSYFEQWRKQQARISYADMLYEPVMAIRRNPELERLVANKMDIVLVDEYQDTNDIQHELLTCIAGNRAKVTVVGDPDQTIYEFRGAKPEYMITGFAKQFSDAKHCSLSYSFRYGHAVALLANHLITHNRERRDLLCKTHNSNPCTQVYLKDTREIVSTLTEMAPDQWNDTAVLVRVWSQSVSIELALLAQGLPYQMAGYQGVFHSDEAQSLFAILELASGELKHAEQSYRQHRFESLLKFPHVGLGEHDLKEIASALSRYPEKWGVYMMTLIPEDLKKIQYVKLERFARALSVIEKNAKPVRQLLRAYVEHTELYDGIRSLSLSVDQGEERVASIQGMLQFVSGLNGSALEVLQQLRHMQQNALNRKDEGIHLSTIHRAKGLEWRHVLIPGLQDAIYPYVHQRDAVMTKSYLESERRLLYVAMTRAIHSLYLFMPLSSSSRDQKSRFQTELNLEKSLGYAAYIENEELPNLSVNHLIQRYFEELAIPLPQVKEDLKTSLHLKDGDQPVWFSSRVRHSMLGEGEVVDEQANAFTVKFSAHDSKVFSKETAHRFFIAL